MDISARGPWPASALSNFASHPFVFEGVSIASMEGFLQALKFEDPEEQKRVCGLVGFPAKRAGKGLMWQRRGVVHWQGREFNRFGDEFQTLLDQVYHELYSQSETFRAALLASGTEPLEHSVGKMDRNGTILTRDEFCSRLRNLRDLLTSSQRIETRSRDEDSISGR